MFLKLMASPGSSYLTGGRAAAPQQQERARNSEVCSMSRSCCMELPGDFGNRWNTRGIDCNMRNTERVRELLQLLDLIASAVGTDPEPRGCRVRPGNSDRLRRRTASASHRSCSHSS